MTPADLVARQLAAYNRRDIDAFCSCFADDVVVHNLTDAAPKMVGIDPFRESYGRMFEANPGLRASLASRMVLGDFVIDEERVFKDTSSEEIHIAAIYRISGQQIAEVWFTR